MSVILNDYQNLWQTDVDNVEVPYTSSSNEQPNAINLTDN